MFYLKTMNLQKLQLHSLLFQGGDATAMLDVPMKCLPDYYMTDVISRASPTMAKCIKAVKIEESRN